MMEDLKFEEEDRRAATAVVQAVKGLPIEKRLGVVLAVALNAFKQTKLGNEEVAVILGAFLHKLAEVRPEVVRQMTTRMGEA